LLKDFQQSNYSVAFVEKLEPDYNSIINTIAFELQRNESRADTSLMQLQYRVDISETQLKRYLNKNENENYFAVLAEVIVKRVLQKVVIKQYYKNKDDV
jgi:hypothetical protein